MSHLAAARKQNMKGHMRVWLHGGRDVGQEAFAFPLRIVLYRNDDASLRDTGASDARAEVAIDASKRISPP
jgi:hypothetical protein